MVIVCVSGKAQRRVAVLFLYRPRDCCLANKTGMRLLLQRCDVSLCLSVSKCTYVAGSRQAPVKAGDWRESFDLSRGWHPSAALHLRPDARMPQRSHASVRVYYSGN